MSIIPATLPNVSILLAPIPNVSILASIPNVSILLASIPNVSIVPAPLPNVSIIPVPAEEYYELYVEFHICIRFRSGFVIFLIYEMRYVICNISCVMVVCFMSAVRDESWRCMIFMYSSDDV